MNADSMKTKSEAPTAGSKTQPTVKIKFLTATSCETAEGAQLRAKAGEIREVPARAAEYLIRVGKAEAA